MLSAGVDPRYASPGVAGFLVVFFLAVATWLLIRSMVGHLRKVRYSPDPAAESDEAADAGVTGGGGAAGADRAERAGQDGPPT